MERVYAIEIFSEKRQDGLTLGQADANKPPYQCRSFLKTDTENGAVALLATHPAFVISLQSKSYNSSLFAYSPFQLMNR